MSKNKYKEIGIRLQDARQSLGLSIDDVHLKTQISKRYLMALEAGVEADLPGDYYTQSIIKQYADLVHVDSAAIQRKHNEPKSVELWRLEHEDPQTRLDRDRKVKPSVLRGLIRQLPWTMSAVLVVVILLLSWGLFNGMAGHGSALQKVNHPKITNHVEQSSEKSSSTSQSSASSSTSSSKATSTSEAKLSKVSGDPNNLTLKLGSSSQATMKITTTGRSWISLNNTTTTTKMYQGASSANSSANYSLKKGSSYSLQIGNATVTEVEVNGKTIPKPTQNTQIRNITIAVTK